MDPEDVEALLRPYHECVRSELERYSGTVENFIGDAVMALFGAPTALRLLALRALPLRRDAVPHSGARGACYGQEGSRTFPRAETGVVHHRCITSARLDGPLRQSGHAETA